MPEAQPVHAVADTRRLLFIGIDPTHQLDIQTKLNHFNFEFTFCATPLEGIQTLKKFATPTFEAVIIDECMLDRDDFKAFHSYQKQPIYNVIPLILQINNPRTEIVQKALENGVYFSLNYPYNASLFKTVLMAATYGFSRHLEVAHRLANFENVHPLMQKAIFHVKTIQDAQTVSSVLAFITPDQKHVAIGLFELILNSIEHGNLGIGYEEKTRLTSKGSLQAEIERRLHLPENQHKHVEVSVERFKEYLQFTIKDNGQGFDFSSYLDYVENRALHHHGRGIMIANQLSFDALDYQDSGSKAICKVNL